jgi:hypothetical protein
VLRRIGAREEVLSDSQINPGSVAPPGAGSSSSGLSYTSEHGVATAPSPLTQGTGPIPVAQIPAASATRSTAVTLTGYWFLVAAVLGGFGILAAVAANPSSQASGKSFAIGFALLFGLPLLIGSLIAGKRILNRDGRGRTLGIVIAGIGVLFDLFSLSRGGSALVFTSLLLNGAVVWVLASSDEFA